MVESMTFTDARAGALASAHRQLLGRAEQLRRTLGELSARRPASCWSYAHGPAQLARRLQRDAAECHHSVWHLSPGPLLETAAAVVPAELRAANPLVDVRCAMPASSLTQKPWLRLCLGRYSRFVVAPVLQRILLLDRSVVVFPGAVLPRGTQTFVATSHPDLLELTEL